MKPYPKSIVFLTVIALVTLSRAATAATSHTAGTIVDELKIGDDSSEQAHSLKAPGCERFTGGLDEPALKLLPSGSKEWESAPMEFTLKVDPDKQNYITARLWGSDKGEELGRMVVYIDDKQLGYTGAGDYSGLNDTADEAEAPGRFFYETVPLPPQLTKGKASVNVRIVVRGPKWNYGATFDKFQKPFTKESRGMYAFYIHTNGYFVPPSNEKQGQTPEASVRPGPGEEVMQECKDSVINHLNEVLDGSSTPSGPQIAGSLGFLASAYNTSWTPAFHNSKAIDKIIQMGDAQAEEFSQDPNVVSKGWEGRGPLGEAIMLTWPAIGERMNEKLPHSDMTRREAWSKMLEASIAYWRTHRRSYTNQSMIVDRNIYTANRGLALINPSLALPEAKALHYVYEAVGLEPWLGSDTGGENTGEKDLPMANVTKPLGSNYYEITKKGLSRELGFVAGYGETILRFVHDMAVLTGDEKVRQQLKKIEHARQNFRCPAIDPDGYRSMKLTSEIDERGEHFPMSGVAYTDNLSSRENWGMDLPALLSDDPATVGAAQQQLEDNQYFTFIASRLKSGDWLGLMRSVDDYQKVKGLPASTSRLPMSKGQPDFVFSDEENAVLALKHGDTRLFVNLYYRAENAVNRVGRILEITPQMTRIATVRTQVEFDPSGQTFVRPDYLQGIRKGNDHLNPPGEDSHQAWAGEEMPIAKRPDDASQPEYGNWGPFLGKATFYWVRYGNYLIGVNTTSDRTFTLPAQANVPHAKDLVSGKEIDMKNGVPVGPLTTVVLFVEGA